MKRERPSSRRSRLAISEEGRAGNFNILYLLLLLLLSLSLSLSFISIFSDYFIVLFLIVVLDLLGTLKALSE